MECSCRITFLAPTVTAPSSSFCGYVEAERFCCLPRHLAGTCGSGRGSGSGCVMALGANIMAVLAASRPRVSLYVIAVLLSLAACRQPGKNDVRHFDFSKF